MAAPLSLSSRLFRKAPRIAKSVRRWLGVIATGGVPDTRLVFVVGSQRSGTRLPLHVLDHAPDLMTYNEGTSPYFRSVLLAPLAEVRRAAARSPFRVVVLKPICETHRLPELLAAFPRSRAIWIFRGYRDTVNSSSTKWKSGKEAVRRLAAGELQAAGWRAGGLSEARLEEVRRLYNDQLTLPSANAIMWYLRNSLYFDLDVDQRSDVVLVRYEDMVTLPAPSIDRMARFVDVRLPPSARDVVFSSSVSKAPAPEIPENIACLCDRLEERLLAHYAAVSGSGPVEQRERERA